MTPFSRPVSLSMLKYSTKVRVPSAVAQEGKVQARQVGAGWTPARIEVPGVRLVGHVAAVQEDDCASCRLQRSATSSQTVLQAPSPIVRGEALLKLIECGLVQPGGSTLQEAPMSTEAGIITQHYHCVAGLVKRWPDDFTAELAGDLPRSALAGRN